VHRGGLARNLSRLSEHADIYVQLIVVLDLIEIIVKTAMEEKMRNLSIVESEHFACANCGHRGELNTHGRCETCNSESVFPDRHPLASKRQEKKSA
jgi:predicted Zn-ribbon and HTH transcriptional regulator